jgi:hypothetical protein
LLVLTEAMSTAEDRVCRFRRLPGRSADEQCGKVTRQIGWRVQNPRPQ